MKSCRNIHGLMAASLYETLDEADQIVLQDHLSACAPCAAEHAGLQTLVGLVPNEPVVFTGDLRPALSEALRCDESTNRSRFWPTVFAAMVVFIIACIGFMSIQNGMNSDLPRVEVAHRPVNETLLAARALSDAGDHVAARTLLEAGIAQHVGDRVVGLLRLEVAQMEFIDFTRYEESYRLYLSVRSEFSNVWSQSSGVVKERFDLLTEARDTNFEALYQIDAARAQGERGIPALELVMAKYPGRTLAREALNTMVACVEGEGLGGLELVKEHVTNPIAMAQLDVRLGEGYWNERHDPVRGRALLEGVADGPHEVPARMARETLARLGA